MKYGFRNPSCVNLDNPKRSNIKLNVLKVKQNADLENVFHFLTNASVGKGQFCRVIRPRVDSGFLSLWGLYKDK